MEQLSIYIWGTGIEAERCVHNLDLNLCKILGYIETNPSKKIWRNEKVYVPEILKELDYDYLMIANIYYDEIIEYIREKELVDESKIIDWMKFRECTYFYPEGIKKLFKNSFLKEISFPLDLNKRSYNRNLLNKLKKYKKIYVYDLRLIDSELDIGVLINEILSNMKSLKIGMAFIPNENYMDINWYHNLLYILDREAIVIWNDEEGDYAEYVKNFPDRFSFIKFHILLFKRKEIRKVHKGRYMEFKPILIYEEQLDLIKQANCIKICNFRCDRIGEEIRVLNSILNDEYEAGIFKLYIPIDAYSRPFMGTNACFNELVGRRINILKSKEEYYLWIRDIFENYAKYDYDNKLIDVYHLNCGIWENNLLLDFYKYELKSGRSLIKEKMNIDNEYVCIHSRDAIYLKNTLPECNSTYHNFRDVPFYVYNKVINYLNNIGIQSVRMGQIAAEENINKNCINFANEGYDEFLDLILIRFCKFYIGCDSGISMMSKIFGKPMLMLMSFFPYVTSNLFVHRNDLCIFKRVYSMVEQRELYISEIFDFSIDLILKGETKGDFYVQHKLEVIPFSSEDVLEATLEMNEKLNGTWKNQNEDKILHSLFKFRLEQSIKKHNIDLSRVFCIEVATSFLRKYQYLLEN